MDPPHVFTGPGPPFGGSLGGQPLPGHDLEVFIDEVSDLLAAEYLRIQRRAREDPGTAGDEGEENWRELLEQWLPKELAVVTKGRIIGHAGAASPQVDVLVLRPGYPRALLNKKTYFAGGVLAAFECKLTVKPEHVPRAAVTSRAIRALCANRLGTPYRELNSPIFFGLLAHATVIRQDPISKIDRLLTQALAGDSHPQDALGAVCVANLATWHAVATVMPRPTGFDDVLWATTRKLHGLDEEGGLSRHYMRWVPMRGNDVPPRPLYPLVARLLELAAWEVPPYRPLAEYWTLAQARGSGSGAIASRSWPFSILSDQVASGIRRGLLTQGDRWSPWKRFY